MRALPALVSLTTALLATGCGRPVGSQQGYAPEQPIAYSHALHAGEYKVDCQYCHFGAAKSRHAGVPPASVCMNCHTQVKKDAPEIRKLALAVAEDRPIEWVKVHRLPDHAYFSHATHVGGAALACQQCHGPVETMVRVEQVETMTMGWCLDCHRQTQAAALTSGAAPVPGVEPITPTSDCSGCHR